MREIRAALAGSKSKPNIKFASGEQLEFFSTLRQRVDAYFIENKISRNANGAMVLKTVVLLAGYFLPFLAIVVLNPPFWLSLILWVVIGISLAGIGMSVMHDANHGAYSEKENVNRWIGYSLNLLGGTSFNWKMQHNVLHHTYTNITGLDEDIDTKLILRFSPHSEHKGVHKHQWYYAFFFYAILTLYWGLLKDLVQYFQYKKAGLNRNNPQQNRIWLFKVSVMKLAYFFIALGVPVLCGVPFFQVLLGFLLMHAVAGLILSVVFQLAHTVEETQFPMPDNTGQMDDTWAIHQLKTTMNFSRGNRWLSWYVGGLNFQVEHHLFSRICHVHYPSIAPIVKRTAEEFGIPYLEKRTFSEALRSHIGLLKQCGRPALHDIGG